MIAPWTRSRTARQVRLLAGGGVAPGSWLVIDLPELARALARGADAVQVMEAAGPVDGDPAGGLAAVVAPVRLVDDVSAASRLAAWRDAVRPGGVVVLVGAGDRARPSRWLLEAGLKEPRQGQAGRIVVTAGDVPGAPA